MLVLLRDRPIGKRAALALGCRERVEFLADAGRVPIADHKPAVFEARHGSAETGQRTPSLHPCGAIVDAERARDREFW
jgi:hypothetical protein